ncbi:D-isomer specific 2-hydroxyacid dehydrogenase, putative [Trichomonas vaginalis G3]|uniref:D-isomer specific 2-hydroxyacid dehydrogenase, putative n=1 Tax=Trichomonas vaginalis (strain ATCC PRA-98 / G3) TaxID=412133 RepID=A2F8V0_TRIV3|nr:phosphoglycerate dehydrogenase protein [Trichomonas vaginalis G3]EAX98686.1 D-isomer specific 2-hydroxyacid dehydrogenase, putative [Trichomonas vaginalis G3]KAI5545817.1 phosphoglycerate dehydrogenase protein [Trichomonas vaginalis G3]|eukprot:XP_001311616.1 D-isomer specific 2-hydroxyacid dehydrogenase [Trichomonas vaginalis G3]
MVKILIADSLSPKAVEMLKAAGHEVRMDPSITQASLANEISDYNVLIVRSKVVNAAAIEAAKGLNLIIRAGAGVNTIDVNAASAKGVLVCNTPGMNNDAVAELAFGHIVCCDRCITTNTAHLRNGEWRKKLFLTCEGLRDRTLGIVGRGNIAKSMIRIAKGFMMNVVVWSRRFTPEEAKELGVEYAASLTELAAKSDVVSVHVAFNKTETFHLIGKEFFDAMKKKAIFINTSRGEVVDTQAMLAAIKERGLKVGVDVFEGEPAGSMGDFPHKEVAEAVVSATCHIGASTEQAADRIANETVRVCNTFCSTGEALNCVNINAAPKADGVMTVRHTGVFAKIIACCEAHQAQIFSVSNTVLKGDKSQICTLRMSAPACFMEEVNKIEGVIGTACAPLA